MQVSHSDTVFAFQVRYRDAMLRAWMNRTGRKYSYRPEEVPAYINAPTNEERGRAEAIEFCRKPLAHGETYRAYLHCDAPRGDSSYPRAYRITTWTGDTLATVISYHVSTTRAPGYVSNVRGSYWARGIDGRLYHGRHCGAGIICTMRLAKRQ